MAPMPSQWLQRVPSPQREEGRARLPPPKVDMCISRKVCINVVLQKSIPAQIRQLIFHISDDKGQVDGFVRELTFAKQLYKYVL